MDHTRCVMDSPIHQRIQKQSQQKHPQPVLKVPEHWLTTEWQAAAGFVAAVHSMSLTGVARCHCGFAMTDGIRSWSLDRLCFQAGRSRQKDCHLGPRNWECPQESRG